MSAPTPNAAGPTSTSTRETIIPTPTILTGDCLERLATLPDASVDAIVTDPPYGLSALAPKQIADVMAAWAAGDRTAMPTGAGFMGKGWDVFVPPPAVWDECLRVLKPGGHLLAFAGSRTHDLMGLSIRLAGFEIRDSIFWHFGSGFPKSHNVSKSLGSKVCRCEAVPYSHEDVSREAMSGVRPDVAAGEPVPVSPKSDVLEGVQREADQPGEEGSTCTQRPADNGFLCGVLGTGEDSAGVGEAQPEDLLLASVQRCCEGQGLGDSRTQGSCCVDSRVGGVVPTEDVRREQSCVEGRGDVQASEGELRRPALREVSGGVVDDGTFGRVHLGASASDGTVGRAAVDANGSGESHRPRSAEQRAGESGVVSDERGSQAWRGWPVCGGCGKPRVPEGLGTALKPATEPCVVARKPVEGTVAANVLQYGTGALNIDGCRIGSDTMKSTRSDGTIVSSNSSMSGGNTGRVPGPDKVGRWPANVALDADQAAVLDQQSGVSKSNVRRNVDRDYTAVESITPDSGRGGDRGHSDSGGASRFFYVAKAPKSERPNVDGVQHPTVKPLALMRWLVRLVTPPGGVVCDPFAGSGSTVEAALLEGFDVIGIEREPDYLPLIQARIDRVPVTLADAA